MQKLLCLYSVILVLVQQQSLIKSAKVNDTAISSDISNDTTYTSDMSPLPDTSYEFRESFIDDMVKLIKNKGRDPNERKYPADFLRKLHEMQFKTEEEITPVREILIMDSEEEVLQRFIRVIEGQANLSIAKNGVFKIGLSGGSLTTLLANNLPNVTTDWTKWRLFFCDERIVPFESEESTFGVYKRTVIGKVPLTESQFITIDPNLSAEDAAKDYIKKMSVYFPPDKLPRFDLLLLGVGPDGHTCSLFPGHRLCKENSVWVAPITDSPKPPPCRITLTFPVINNADHCMFTVMGRSKAEIIQHVLEESELPAANVRPTEGKVIWLLDKPAASLYTP